MRLGETARVGPVPEEAEWPAANKLRSKSRSRPDLKQLEEGPEPGVEKVG